MPAAYDGRAAGDLAREPRMPEQHHQLGTGSQAPERGKRAGAEIGASLPRTRFGIHQDDTLHVARGTSHDGHPVLAQRLVEDVAGADRVRAPHVVVDDLHCQRRPEARGLAPQQVCGAIRQPVRERAMHRDIGQPLVGARRPGRDGGFVARQRLVRAGRWMSDPIARSSAAITLRTSSTYKSASHPAATAVTVAAGTGCAALAPAMIRASVTTSPAKLSGSRR